MIIKENNMETLLGKLYGADLVIKTNDPEIIKYAEKRLARVDEIYFMGYPGGYHPDFFKHYPELKKK